MPKSKPYYEVTVYPRNDKGTSLPLRMITLNRDEAEEAQRVLERRGHKVEISDPYKLYPTYQDMVESVEIWSL